jgi:hypothetical protein
MHIAKNVCWWKYASENEYQSLFAQIGLLSASQNESLSRQIKVSFVIDDDLAQTNHNKNSTIPIYSKPKT